MALSLGKPTYSWVTNPSLLNTQVGTYTYKDMPYAGNFGLGLANAGINENNLEYYMDLIRDKHEADDKAGGWREVYNKMEDFADQYKNPALKNYLETGNVTKGVNADTVLQAMDYGLRGLAQKQQNKKGFFDNPFVRATIAAGTALATGNLASGAQAWRATAPNNQPKQKTLQPTGSTPNVTKNVEDVKLASQRNLQQLQAPSYTASPPSDNAPLTNLGQYFPQDIYDRSVYEAEGDVTNPYNLVANALPMLTAINQFFPQDVYDRSVTDAALLPDNNIVDRARLTNMAEGFVDPKTSQERANDFLNKLTGLGLGMAQDAKTTPPVFLTPPPVSGQRFQYNPYKFGSPQGMPISFLANRARGQMKTPFQYELEKLVRKV
tara:strand:- start:15839 stop:16975 length:1137 start_codon:yes stop_codon:yes gene_type:complete